MVCEVGGKLGEMWCKSVRFEMWAVVSRLFIIPVLCTVIPASFLLANVHPSNYSLLMVIRFWDEQCRTGQYSAVDYYNTVLCSVVVQCSAVQCCSTM